MIRQLSEDVVEGPSEHPKFGRSVTIRPTVETARANRYPTQAVVVTTAARRLIELSKEGEKVPTIVVEGAHCDPTLHPDFHEISRNLRELTNKWFPKAALCLLSESPDLSRPQVRHALSFYDRPILSLEAGTQKTYQALTGQSAQVFKDRVQYMGRLEIEKLVVRTEFVRGDVDNSKDTEVRAWLRHLDEIRPASVQLSTPPKANKSSKPITKTRMTQIADLVAEKIGVPVEVCEG